MAMAGMLLCFSVFNSPVFASEAAAEISPEAQASRDLLLTTDYGDAVTYVIGHKSPDADTVGCAMAYAYLLNEIGIEAQAVVSDDVNNETQTALDAFGLEAPPVMHEAHGKQFILVDHSNYSQAIDGMEDARVVGIVDHHGIGDVEIVEPMNVRSAPVGAAASLVFLAYRECEVPVPQDMARIMLMSILSDTRNMVRNVTEVDQQAYDTLVPIAQIEDINALYKSMAEALASYGDMTDEEIYYSDYKEYVAGQKTFCVADVNAFGEEKMRDLAARMRSVMEAEYEESGLDYLFTIINNKSEDESENMMYMTAYGPGAEEVLQEVFANQDETGLFVFKENLSRKTTVAPAISEYLE